MPVGRPRTSPLASNQAVPFGPSALRPFGPSAVQPLSRATAQSHAPTRSHAGHQCVCVGTPVCSHACLHCRTCCLRGFFFTSFFLLACKQILQLVCKFDRTIALTCELRALFRNGQRAVVWYGMVC